MAKRCTKRRGSKTHGRTKRGGEGGSITFPPPHNTSLAPLHQRRIGGWAGGGRKKMMRTRRRTRRGGQSAFDAGLGRGIGGSSSNRHTPGPGHDGGRL